MSKPTILIIDDNSGTITLEIMERLRNIADLEITDIVSGLQYARHEAEMVNGYYRFWFEETHQAQKTWNRQHLMKPLSEFEKRREWLNGFRSKHRRQRKN